VRPISEVVGQKGVYTFLNKMKEISDSVKTSDLEQLIVEANISQNLFSDLANCGLFISTPKGFYISSLGKKVNLLLKVINGDSDISELFNQLNDLYPDLKPYELITANITDYFINSIERYADFIRIYICSPWIRLDEIQLNKFQGAVLKASRLYSNLQILIITKPKEGYHNWEASAATFKTLRSLGAEIVTNNRLHTKLYLSEPGPYGGLHYAILGSENLTGRKNIELAIKIEKDNKILRKLNQYFYEIRLECQISKEA